VLTSVDRPTILVVYANSGERERVRDVLDSAGFDVATAGNGKEAVEAICARPPLCVVIEEDLSQSFEGSILAELKGDNVYGHLPIVAVLDPEELDGIDWRRLPADDYVVKPVYDRDLVSRVKLSMARAQRDIHANPLTGLPGNPTIMIEAERRLQAGTPFGLAHADLDSFKPFNDHYGFARGDEVIRMTARLLVNTVRALDSSDTHVGHIGGDDFVFLAPSDFVETVCRDFLRDFDQIIPNFYDPDDLMRGSIASVNRKGEAQTFPIMTCSIGVVDTATAAIQHIGDLCHRVAEVKSFAKKLPGSNYLIDRRSR
jgi:GGDEF domain-containing protein